ncbi:MAG TPA: hypothetical protein VFX96_16590 [Pyrinomonadaceae bacterium]|nr:hypothetical protein [Pyrinomonadaceae bacterium]
MRRTLAALLSILLLASAAGDSRPARAQNEQHAAVQKTHVFLFDVSGSMNKRYGENETSVKEWLVRPLLKNGAFGSGDKLIVRWFDQSGSSNFNPNDARRKVKYAPYGEQTVLDNVPTVRDAGAPCTNIPEALDLTLADITGYNVSGDVLIWLVTDNVQDSCSRDANKDIAPFYNKIAERQGREFFGAHLFPLGKEAGQPISGKPALILYLLHYAKGAPRLTVRDVADIAQQTARRIDNPAITWLPFESAVVPGPEFTESEEIEVLGDGVVRLKTPIQEGDPLNLNFSFRLRPPRQRAIRGKIKNERFQLEWPSFVSVDAGEAAAESVPSEGGDSGEVSSESTESSEVSGDGAASSAQAGPAWDVQVSPDDIVLLPEGRTRGAGGAGGGNRGGQTSQTEYTVVMSNPAGLRPAGFFSALASSTSPPIQGILLFDLADLQTEVQFDNPALEQVPNTDIIKTIVGKTTEKPRSIPIAVEFQVQYNNARRWLLLAVVGIVLLGLLLGLILLLTMRTRFELQTPSGERTIALPVVGSQYVAVNGMNAAVISKRFGNITVAPLGSFTIGGAKTARPLTGNNDQFTIESPDEGRSYPHAFRRLTRAANVSARKDTFLDD